MFIESSDIVTGHSSATAKLFYQLKDREQDARNTLEVAKILSSKRGSTELSTPTVVPQQLQAIMDSGHRPATVAAAARAVRSNWMSLDWGSGRADRNQTRAVWTDEEIAFIGVLVEAIRDLHPGRLYFYMHYISIIF